jgi:uncharacterized membrane protein (UPF0127 family)
VDERGYRRVIHEASGRVLLERARWCDTFGRKLRGLTFRRSLPPGGGLVLVERSDGRAATSIHMMFVFFDLGVLWADGQGRVVDKRRARPWRLSYVPQAPARYVVEGDPAILDQVQVGESIRFEPAAD